MYGWKQRALENKVIIPDHTLTDSKNVTTISNPGGIRVHPPGLQKTKSGGHIRSKKDGKYHDGGPFYTIRQNISLGITSVSVSAPGAGGGTFKYSGPVWTPYEFSGYPAGVSEGNTSSLIAAGASAISQSAPTNPVSDAGVAIGETYREGLPSLPGVSSWRRRTEILKNAGSEYLNAVFGWMPLVSEVTDVSRAASNASRIAKQYEKDEGSSVGRRFVFPTESSYTVKTLSSSGSAAVPVGSSGSTNRYNATNPANLGEWIKETFTSRKRWFSGSFTYTLPRQSDSWGGLVRHGDQADHLLGLKLTPDVLWELSPWSWAIDWFSNTGDVINNLSMFTGGGLVMRYGYMMEESSTKHVYTLTKMGLINHQKSAPPPPTIVETVVKRRIEANPFGFGVSWEGLSSFQASVAAALGISRV
jgi:hypothetical protein